MAVPTDFASLKVWYDFADDTTLLDDSAGAIDDTDIIGSVTDKGGALDLTGDTGSGPTWRSAIKNSLGVARFDTGKLLTRATVTLSDIIAANAGTVQFVADIPAGNCGIYDFNDAAANFFSCYASFSDTRIIYWGNPAGGGQINTSPAGSDGNWHVFTARRKTDNSFTFRVDGVEQFNGTFSDTLDTADVQTWTIGQMFSAVTDVGEIFICNAALSDADMAAGEAYLGTRWDITVSSGNRRRRSIICGV